MDIIDHSLKPHQRIAWLDLCRVVAIIGVIVIHSCAILLKPWGIYSIQEWLVAANFLDSLARCSVPLFVMVSGALILRPGKNPSIFQEILRRIVRVAIPLLVWEAVIKYYFTNNFIGWADILIEPPAYHFWFVYMIMGIYLLLPIYQGIFNFSFDRPKLQIYLFLVWVLFAITPTSFPNQIMILFGQNGLLQFGGYFLMGAFLARYQWDRIPTSFLVGIFFVCVWATDFITLSLSLKRGELDATGYSNFSLNVLGASISAFLIVKRLKVPEVLIGPIAKLSDVTFLIYFIHVIFIDMLVHNSSLLTLQDSLPGFAMVLVIAIGATLISIFFALILRIIPGSRIFLG